MYLQQWRIKLMDLQKAYEQLLNHFEKLEKTQLKLELTIIESAIQKLNKLLSNIGASKEYHKEYAECFPARRYSMAQPCFHYRTVATPIVHVIHSPVIVSTSSTPAPAPAPTSSTISPVLNGNIYNVWHNY